MQNNNTQTASKKERTNQHPARTRNQAVAAQSSQDISTDQFLKAFFPDEQESVNLRAFYAKGDPRADGGRKYPTTRRQLNMNGVTAREVRDLNSERGLYFVVNSGGDKDEDISRYNAVFVEADDKTIEDQHSALDACPLGTSIRVETLKSVHAYWLLKGDCAEEQWRELQRRLIHYFDGDKANKNPSRVMRLPGYEHLTYAGVDEDGKPKFERKRVGVVHFKPGRRYTIDELLEAFPAVPEEEKPKREATPRANTRTAEASAKLPLTLEDIKHDPSNSFEEWKAGLIVKISEHKAATLNSQGNIDCRAYCHNGVGATGLFCSPAENTINCLNEADGATPCTLKEIAAAFKYPMPPRSKGTQTECIITPRVDFSHDGVLKDILSNLPTDVDFQAEAGLDSDKNVTRETLSVIVVEKVIEVAQALGCGLAKHLDFVYQFNGQYWKQIERDELTRFLGEAAEKLGVKRTTARAYLFRDMLLKQFLSTAYLPPPSLQNGVTLVNLANGTFEISADKRELREFRREDFLTYQLPFAYDPTAKAPMWERFLNEVLPDTSTQNICAEFMGYCFTTNLKLEKVMLLYGSGANGKSVFFEVMNALFGKENISTYGLAHLSHEYNRAMIANKLLNYSSELAGKYATDIFKQLASGEPIQARLPYGQPFELRRYAKLAFNANERPVVTEHTKAFFRRFLIVPFDVMIEEERQDKDLASKIIVAELPGIFNWVVAGLERLLEQRKFSRCEAVEKANDDYKRESDSVRLFVDDEGWEADASAETALADLYAAYKSYCQENGYAALGRKNFTIRLDSLGVSRTLKKRQPFYHLSRSVSEDEEPEQVPFNVDDSRRHLRIVGAK
jgi:putative DNA primase/helicase